jgi:tetratricopeptide (TPR) repeat protein
MSRTAPRDLDPDTLAALEDERDHLLASLEDIEREHSAGDLDEADYTALKDDYTVRAAEVIEAIERRRRPGATAPTGRRRGRTMLVTTGVLVFGLSAGMLVARSAGQRGDAPITGGLGSLRAELSQCRAASLESPAAGIDCYGKILENAPGNAEALTYRGWAYVRDDRVEEGGRLLARAVEADPDYPDARVFSAVVAARAGDYERAADEIDRFYRNGPSPAAIQVLQSQGLEREVFVRLLEPRTRACWTVAAAGSGDDAEEGGAPDPATFFGLLGQCLDRVIGADPDNVDALISRTYALLSAGGGSLTDGVALAERAVAAAPADPDALLMRASVALADGRPDDARADLDRLESLRRPLISIVVGGPEQLRAAIEDAANAGSTTTVPRRSGGPVLPNRDGG